MRLFYYRQKNFGDALNPIIWSSLLPGYFEELAGEDAPEGPTFIGIGSILGHELPLGRKIVFSTGYAYGDPPLLDGDYEVLCVRGPLTAGAVGLPPSAAVTDGAILVRLLEIAPAPRTHAVSFMPHIRSEGRYDWKSVCEDAGIHYLSPTRPARQLVAEIASSQLVIAEAMHAAIVADALRVPWVPCLMYPQVNTFKWIDWTRSLGLEYEPHAIKPLYSQEMIRHKVEARLAGGSMRAGSRSLSWAYRTRQRIAHESGAVSRFLRLQRARPSLSDDGVVTMRIEQLSDRLDRFRARYPAPGGSTVSSKHDGEHGADSPVEPRG